MLHVLFKIFGINDFEQAIADEDKCKKCKGKKTVQERKILEVHVDKGMKHGQKITFHGAADEEPGVIPGDVVVVLQCEKHDRFLRKVHFANVWRSRDN